MPVEKAYNSLSYLRRGGPDALKAKFEQLQDKLAHPPPGARQLEGMEELWTSCSEYARVRDNTPLFFCFCFCYLMWGVGAPHQCPLSVAAAC